jgi:hypothetical protein
LQESEEVTKRRSDEVGVQSSALHENGNGNRNDNGADSAIRTPDAGRGHVAGNDRGSGNGSPPQSERRAPADAAPAGGAGFQPAGQAGCLPHPSSEREAPASAAPADARSGEETAVVRRVAPAPKSKIQNPKSKTAPRPLQPRDLPAILSGLRIRQLTPFGNMHVKITVDPRTETELEVFAQLGKGGDVANSDLEAICRMISLWLRAGGPLILVIKQLEGIGSSLQIPTRNGRIVSLGDGLASALKKYLRAKERFGLRDLLLGEIDPAELDNPLPPPHHRPALDRPAARATNGGNGNGHGPQSEREAPASAAPEGTRYAANGHDLHGAHDGQESPSEPEAQAEGPRGPSRGHGNGNGHDRELAALLAADEDAHGAESQLQASDFGLHHSPAAPAFGLQASALAVSATTSHDPAGAYKVHCPECGNQLARQEGCAKCHACGWAQC